MPIDREETLKKAEKLLRQGKLDQAILEYERVVEDQPKDWTTANALGDLYLRANKTDRAVGLYQKIADHLFAEGFYPKAAALYRKTLKLAPGDEKVLLNLAEISIKQGLLADARAHLTGIAKRRRDRNDMAGADDIVIRLGSLDPADIDARTAAARVVETRGETADAARRYREIYDYLAEKGREADGIGALKEAARCDPEDQAARAILARAAVERGDLDEARHYLDREAATSDPALLYALITVELQAGRIEEARDLLPQLFALDPTRRYTIVELAWSMAESNIFAAATCIDAAANALIASGEFAEAASILQEFAARVPGQVNALLKLVEVCVDGGLEATMYEAQAQLADAYLAIGLASEARVIAEDLLSREPWEPAHMERLRRALVMLKVPDVEAALKERLSAPPDEHISPVVKDEPPEESPSPLPKRKLLSEKPLAPIPEPPPPPPAPPPAAPPPRTEIDLTTVLGDLHETPPGATGADHAVVTPQAPPQDLGRVFSGMRAKVDEDEGNAAEHLSLGKTYLEMGMADDALRALEVAAKSPRHRFEAGGTLARLYRDRGEIASAIEWFELAAQAPSPSFDEGRALLYDLGVTLQDARERERALAVFLELDAEAPNYRDVAGRIADLSRETGG